MHLSREEEAILEGDLGQAAAKAMKLLVRLGELGGAERMIRVDCVHISGVSYRNLGPEGLEFLEDFCRGAKVLASRVSLNPPGAPERGWEELSFPEDFLREQLRVLRVFASIGVKRCKSCTPYFGCNLPEPGEHIAWAESSAATFANSVLGCRTNRESSVSSLAAALVGRVPKCGYHVAEARLASHLVEVEVELRGTLAYSALGYALGEMLERGVPYLRGLRNPSAEELAAFAAGIATSSEIALFHVENVTPEAKGGEVFFDSVERVEVEEDLIKEVLEAYSCEDPELVIIGCPHLSEEGLERLARALKAGSEVWVTTSSYAAQRAKGAVRRLKEKGAKVLEGVCAVVSPLQELGFKEVATDSVKAAFYLKSFGFEVGLWRSSS